MCIVSINKYSTRVNYADADNTDDDDDGFNIA